MSAAEADSLLSADRCRPALPAGVLRLGGESLRYLAVSAIALACDVAVYATFIGTGVRASPASAAGYAFGILVHYALSTHWVFPDAHGMRRTAPTLAKFLATGFLGLSTTAAIVEVLTREHMVGAFAAKAAAVGAAYVAVRAAAQLCICATARTFRPILRSS